MRKLLTLLLIIGIALTFAMPAQAEIQAMWAYVYARTSDGQMEDGLTRLTSGVTFKVLQRNSDTAETLYEYPDMDDTLTSLTNPITAANFASDTVCKDRVAFQVDPGETGDRYVDLIVVDTSGGYTAFVEDFDKYQHRIVIDERPGKVHHGIIWFSASSASETDTGIDFDYDTMIHDVRVETVTVDASSTIEVGLLSTETAGDADGFIDARSVATAGYTADTGVITAAATIDYYPDSTYGDLLYTIVAGEVDQVNDNGGRTYLGHIITGSNANSLTYTGLTGQDTAAGYIHYWFSRLR